MTEKFTIEDLFIKIVPGGTLAGIIYLVYGEQFQWMPVEGMGVLYAFILFAFSFLLGEVVQTIAHELEFLVSLFFKGNKPSQVFLYRDNPVLMNENIRCRIIEHLALGMEDRSGFDEYYKNLGWGKRKNVLRDKSQSCFWQLYSNVSDGNEIRTFNRSYLLVRGITVVCLLAVLIFLLERNYPFVIGASVLSLMFLWRARGMARTLVLKTVLLNLKNK